jgi:ankyrin repeat protein/mRNA-degrading endonuclease RelE of RelBE toxin-antitoxin system
MHDKKQLTAQKQRMQQNLQKKRTQDQLDNKLLDLCNTDITNKDLSFTLKLRDAAKALLDNGANVNVKTLNNATFLDGVTPLDSACLTNNLSIVKLLIASGANVNVQNKDGQTSLDIATQKRSFDIVNILTMAGANPNIHNFVTRQIPLYTACFNGDINIANILLQNNAYPDIQRVDYITPLHIAVYKGFINIIKLLFTFHANPNIQDGQGMTPLNLACKTESVEIVEALLNNNANPNIPNKKGTTPLHFAADRGSIDIVKLLLTFHTNINAQTNKDKITPLHFACAKSNFEIVEILLNNQATVNAPKNIGAPLHHAILNDHFFTVALLLKYGANVHAQAEDDCAPIHVAYYKKNRIIIYLLLLYGAEDVSRQQTQQEKQKFFEEVNQKEPEATIPKEVPKKDILIKNQPPQKKFSSTKTLQNKSQPVKNPVTINKSTPQKNTYLILQGKKLKWGKFLSTRQQEAIKDHAKQLKYWPEVHNLDIKPLQGTEKGIYRLRVGTCRVIFSIDIEQHQIFIQEIGLRKNIYKKSKLL